MVDEAERYKDEDEKQRQKIAARNHLESYIFNVKQAVDEAGNKLSEEDKNTIKRECEECLTWLDGNTLAEKEEYEDKLRHLTSICSSIMSKLYNSGAQQQQMPRNCGQQAGGFSGSGHNGPTIEEVD
ncbi:hypothetical protein Trydic_g1936 [Trypoxylus dichotomus]